VKQGIFFKLTPQLFCISKKSSIFAFESPLKIPQKKCILLLVCYRSLVDSGLLLL